MIKKIISGTSASDMLYHSAISTCPVCNTPNCLVTPSQPQCFACGSWFRRMVMENHYNVMASIIARKDEVNNAFL